MNHINPSIKTRLHTEKWDIKPLSYYLTGIIDKRDYYILSEGITLLESSVPAHRKLSHEILSVCYNHRTPSFRMGITGSPGVGKSTFIDSIAGVYSDQGDQVGILTIDPSSIDGKGSILGDKTRMEEIGKDKNIYIRPSPTNRHLGGINQYTFESMILCEAAGMNKIFVETVGIGQSEVDVSKHTDATVLLVLPGSGDSLQGIKKGIIEKADLIIVHKSDGEATKMSKIAAQEYKEALHLSISGKEIQVINYSSITEMNKDKVIEAINKIRHLMSDGLSVKRKKQERAWLASSIYKDIHDHTVHSLESQGLDKMIDESVKSLSPFDALSSLKECINIQIQLKDPD